MKCFVGFVLWCIVALDRTHGQGTSRLVRQNNDGGFFDNNGFTTFDLDAFFAQAAPGQRQQQSFGDQTTPIQQRPQPSVEQTQTPRPARRIESSPARGNTGRFFVPSFESLSQEQDSGNSFGNQPSLEVSSRTRTTPVERAQFPPFQAQAVENPRATHTPREQFPFFIGQQDSRPVPQDRRHPSSFFPATIPVAPVSPRQFLQPATRPRGSLMFDSLTSLENPGSSSPETQDRTRNPAPAPAPVRFTGASSVDGRAPFFVGSVSDEDEPNNSQADVNSNLATPATFFGFGPSFQDAQRNQNRQPPTRFQQTSEDSFSGNRAREPSVVRRPVNTFQSDESGIRTQDDNRGQISFQPNTFTSGVTRQRDQPREPTVFQPSAFDDDLRRENHQRPASVNPQRFSAAPARFEPEPPQQRVPANTAFFVSEDDFVRQTPPRRQPTTTTTTTTTTSRNPFVFDEFLRGDVPRQSQRRPAASPSRREPPVVHRFADDVPRTAFRHQDPLDVSHDGISPESDPSAVNQRDPIPSTVFDPINIEDFLNAQQHQQQQQQQQPVQEPELEILDEEEPQQQHQAVIPTEPAAKPLRVNSRPSSTSSSQVQDDPQGARAGRLLPGSRGKPHLPETEAKKAALRRGNSRRRLNNRLQSLSHHQSTSNAVDDFPTENTIDDFRSDAVTPVRNRRPNNQFDSLSAQSSAPAVYGQPARSCNPNFCRIPNCYCGGQKVAPGGFRPDQIPQIVVLTFDDAVNDLNWPLYTRLFFEGRTNPNGCPIMSTFYVSHEWTDYSKVQTLYSQGHEIASHSISHGDGRDYSKKKWYNEIYGQKEIMNVYANVNYEDIKGMRAPFLAIGGDKMFSMLYETNFTYDTSMTVTEANPPMWPYTLDYAIPHSCAIPPCPKLSYPGFWEIPMIALTDLNGGKCSMADSCSYSQTADGIYDMLMKNFNRYYKSNRAPFGLYYHASWFLIPHRQEGFVKFLDEVLKQDDVYFVTALQMLEWMKNPTPLPQVHRFEPWACDRPLNRVAACNRPRKCELKHKGDVRYMNTCSAECPAAYPWVGSTGVTKHRHVISN